MQQIDNVIVTDRAWAIFRQQQARHESNLGLSIALYYMPTFTNADGTSVEGFAPGYTIDFVVQPPSGDNWVMARLLDGTEFQFMPNFAWRPDESYVVDQASSYTLSIGPAPKSSRR
ncbi:MAG: hypothetical protein ABIY37_13325 [Devosia sp.]